ITNLPWRQAPKASLILRNTSFNHKVSGLAYNQNAILATEGSSMSENGMTRRQFIERTVAGAAATSLTGGARPSRAGVAPNRKITMGIIGVGIRGQEDMQSVLRVGGNVAVVCDLYDGHQIGRASCRG